MITIVHLRDNQHSSSSSFADLVVLNTHWDDRGIVARAESAALILKLIQEEVLEPYRVRNAAEPLVVLLGDLNSVAEEKGYQVLTGGRYSGTEETDKGAFCDTRHELATRETALGGQGAMSRCVFPCRFPSFFSSVRN
jgi:endonuclease/exonuclease/phosphatase family metal-dependent hydrolase